MFEWLIILMNSFPKVIVNWSSVVLTSCSVVHWIHLFTWSDILGLFFGKWLQNSRVHNLWGIKAKIRSEDLQHQKNHILCKWNPGYVIIFFTTPLTNITAYFLFTIPQWLHFSPKVCLLAQHGVLTQRSAPRMLYSTLLHSQRARY